MKKIGDGIHCDNAQLKLGGTYDHNFVINGDGLREAAVLQSNESGIRLTCFTDQPGVQLYVPCYTLHQKGIYGKDYPPYSAVCLETQHYRTFPFCCFKSRREFPFQDTLSFFCDGLNPEKYKKAKDSRPLWLESFL